MNYQMTSQIAIDFPLNFAKILTSRDKLPEKVAFLYGNPGT